MTEDQAIQIVWDYHQLHQALKPADAVFVLGSYNPEVARYGADLVLKGYSKSGYLLISGGEAHGDDLLKTSFGGSEAEYFAKIAEEAGVQREKTILEKNSQNTGQNYQHMKKILTEKGLWENLNSFIIVQKPYMERRCLATGEVQWPEKELRLASPLKNLEDYLSSAQNFKSKDEIVNVMLGDFQRIKEYPQKGFQSEQPIPQNVNEAFLFLVSRGYIKHLIPGVEIK